jgi:hypothetical protein
MSGASVLVTVPQPPEVGVTVQATPGHTERAQELGHRLATAGRTFAGLFGVKVPVRALVLDEDGWRAHCPFPDYGMPYSQPPEMIYAAATDNPLWRTATPDLTALPPGVAARLREVYGEREGVSARRFFDLLVVHELAHLFAHRGGLRFPRRWLEELFCNLALHTYVEREESDQLAALETLPEVVAAIPVERLPHHTLSDWERLFERVGPLAFAWYQCRLHRAAAMLHQQQGAALLTTMWTFFADGRGSTAPDGVDDVDLPVMLASLSPEVAAIAATWPGSGRVRSAGVKDGG